jgi:hypothetical protein
MLPADTSRPVNSGVRLLLRRGNNMVTEYFGKYPYIRLRILCFEEGRLPQLLHVANFLHAFNLLYDFFRLVTDEQYTNYDVSSSWLLRDESVLNFGDQFYLSKLEYKSPLDVVVIVTLTAGAISAISALTMSILNMRKHPLEMEKLREEIQKLKGADDDPDAWELKNYIDSPYYVLEEEILERKAVSTYEEITWRLNKSRIVIRRIEMEIIDPRNKESHEQ